METSNNEITKHKKPFKSKHHFPTENELAENFNTLNQLLDIDPEDIGLKPLSKEEIDKRVTERVKEQNQRRSKK